MSLIFLGKLCDDDCEARINKRVCKVHKEKKTILTAPHCSHGGMHVMNLQNPNPKHLVNASLANKQHKLVNMQDFTDADRTKFLYASIGSLPPSTAKQTISPGCSQSWPGLTIKSLKKLQELDHTMRGHMDYVRKNKLSTKVK